MILATASSKAFLSIFFSNQSSPSPIPSARAHPYLAGVNWIWIGQTWPLTPIARWQLSSPRVALGLLGMYGSNDMVTISCRMQDRTCSVISRWRRKMLASFSSSSIITRLEWSQSIRFAYLSSTTRIWVTGRSRPTRWCADLQGCYLFLIWKSLTRISSPSSFARSILRRPWRTLITRSLSDYQLCNSSAKWLQKYRNLLWREMRTSRR